MQVESWAIKRNIRNLNSTEFRIYLMCFILRHPDKATPELWVAFAFLMHPEIEC